MGKITINNKLKINKAVEKLKDLLWLFPFAKKNVFFIIIFSLLGLTGTVTGLVNSLVSKDLVDIITGHKTAELLKTFLLLIGTALLSTLISQVGSIISTKITLTVSNKFQEEVFDSVLSTEWEALSKYHSAELMMRWSGDSATIANNVLTLIPNIINYSISVISALVIVLKRDVSFAIITLLCVPISLLTSRLSLKRMRTGNAASHQSQAKLTSFLQDTFGNMQTIKALDMIKLSCSRLRDYQKDTTDARIRYQWLVAKDSLILTLISLFTTYIIYGWGIYRVWSGVISYGTMTLFLSMSNTLSNSLQSFVRLLPTTVQLANSAKRVRDLCDLPKEADFTRDEVNAFFEAHKTEGISLCVRNLAYKYPTGTEVFSDASFEAHPHEIVSFVGPSGEGKTTMLRFLLSIIRPQSGYGYICAGNSTPEDNQEQVPLTASVRQLIAYVPQGNTMLSGTISDNMRNVNPNATDEDIIEALKTACAWNFVEKLPDGINTVIQERGGGFSEGQAQRLSIARALLRKSPILLLDEATSALDIETEKKVLTNILEDEYPRTTIVTTHRPSVLKTCNRVYSIKGMSCQVLSKEEIHKMIKTYL